MRLQAEELCHLRSQLATVQDSYVRITAVREKEAELLKKERIRLSQEAERVQSVLDDL